MKFFSWTVVVALMVMCSSAMADYPSAKLVQAIALQESSNNDRAIGDKHLKDRAYGALQVRKPCIDDVNRKFGTCYEAKDCLGNRKLSEWICREYINLYATEKNLGRKPTTEDMARIWNGGPKGFKRSITDHYWRSVQRHLKKLDA